MRLLTNNKKITDVKAGEYVLSRNISTNQDEYNFVKATMRPYVPVSNQLKIILDNGTVVITSKIHPTLIEKENAWIYINAAELKKGDICWAKEKSKILEINEVAVDPYFADFSVENTENYYAGIQPEKMMVVHNSATLYYPIWHLEVEDLLVLKNNKGTEETRIRHMDYGVQFNKLMYERLLTGKEITLFSPNDVPGLYDAFFNDQEKFRELYETAERNTRLRKKKVKAIDLFSSFMQERKDTGRIYLQNVDHANTHSPFDEAKWPIRQSNLCSEIDLPTVPLKHFFDEDGRIALCTLSAINWGNIKEPKDFEKACTLAIRGLDALLSYQEYPVLAAKLSTQDFRPLGVGIINFAYWLAKNDLKYSSPEALAKVDEWAEAWSYYLIKASIDLAEEQGPCERWEDLKYAKGQVPVDTRKIDVDELVPYTERMPWDELRERAKRVGIRNATVMALMPSECQSLENKMKLKDGTIASLAEIIQDHGKIDINTVHENSMIGQRFSFIKPVELANSIAYECYYNGPQNVTEIELEDGEIYRFTDNHKLLVYRDNKEIWIEVKDLSEFDEIISVNAK